MAATSGVTPSFSSQLLWAGYLLGFGLGGFFDGILLHQVLQWHHLLTNVEGAMFQDLGVQMLADGLFHVLMYLITAVGLWKLWRARRDYALPGADQVLLGNVLIGFGAWHILDGILSHWILGIHRIRGDSDNVLLWDLLWFFVFGVAFVLLGHWIRKRGEGGDDGSGDTGKDAGHRARASALMLALTVAVAGPIAALPPRDVDTVMVFFKPGTPAVEIFRAIDEAGGRIIWNADSGDIWALDVKDKSKTRVFYRYGAYLVSNSALAVGCLAWSSVRV